MELEDYITDEAREHDCGVCGRDARAEIDDGYYCYAHAEEKLYFMNKEE